MKMKNKHYWLLIVMALLHFMAMYILMYSMVDGLDNVIPNINNFYMAGLMTMPMLAIELSLMSSLYWNKSLNVVLIATSGLLLAILFLSIRRQEAVGDEQFLKSMIPHHSGAILMCEESQLEDQEIRNLCQEIIEAQKSEIEQMRNILNRIKISS